jgi:hypothetical protein
LQLDQLLLAEGSPLRRAKENQRDRTFLEERLKREVAVRLILKREQWRFFSDGWSGVFWWRGFRRTRRLCQKKSGNGESQGESDQFHAKKVTQQAR